MSSGSSNAPAPPDYAKLFQSGLDVYLKNLPRLTDTETAYREGIDPLRIAEQQGLQDQFGPTQVRQQLDALKQFDPQSFAVRDELSKRVLGDLQSGYDLNPDYARQLEQSVRGAQAARGNIYGNAPAALESSVKGKAALDLYQQRLQNAGNFLSGPTPEQQALAIQAVQPDRSMAYASPAAGTQGVNFGLQNYQNLLAQQQLVGSQRNPWASALGGAATGASTGSQVGGGWGALIGGIGGGLAGYYGSSLKIKRDVVRVGTSRSGLGIYEFRYARGRDTYRGVIAEEVQQLSPNAVWTIGGVLHVNYEWIDVPFEKRCVKCAEFKPLASAFYHRKGGKDGHRSECKTCQDAKALQWKLLNPKRARVCANARTKEWRKRNRPKFLRLSRIRDKARWPRRREQVKEGKRRWRLANPELHRQRVRDRWRRYRAKYPEKARAKGRLADRKRRPQKTAYMRKKRREDINFRLASRLRTSLCLAIQGKSKGRSALDLLGCPLEDFRIYLESKFEPGMTWQNYGYRGWHIDHIMPLAIFDLSKPEHQKRAFHFSNMQPLWAVENMSKKDKPPEVHQFSFL
jgi:hypothetical protein